MVDNNLTQKRSIFWTILIITTFFIVYNIKNALTPFIVGLILSYLANPIVSFCEKYKINRTFTIIAVITAFTVVISLSFIYILPVFYKQLMLLINKIPVYKEIITTKFIPYLISKASILDAETVEKIREYITGAVSELLSNIFKMFNNVWQYTLATLNFLSILFFIPFVMYYALKDWQKMKNLIKNSIPQYNKKKIIEILNEINKLISAYIRGYLNVCLILASYYSCAFSLISIDFAILLGCLAGLLNIVPYLGPVFAFSLTMLITYLHYGYEMHLLYVFIIFAIGQTSESFFLTPNIVGKSIGIKPIFLFLAIFTGGIYFGILGIIFAIPTMGVLSILAKHAYKAYKNSIYYKG